MSELSTGNLGKDYARFAIPCVASLAVYSLYSIVDGIFVSRFTGLDALAAIDLVMPFYSLMYFLAIMMAVGTGTIIARALGEKNKSFADFVFSQNVFVVIAVGLLLTTVTLIFRHPICSFLGANGATYDYAVTYLSYLAPFSTLIILEYNLEVLIKTDGHSKLAFCTVLFSTLTNVFLDWLFVGKFDLGVKGAAVATGIAQAIGDFVFLIVIITEKNGLVHFRRFKPDLSVYKKIIPIGASDGAAEISSAIMLWIYNAVILKYYGNGGIAAYSAVMYAYNLIFNIMTGVCLGMEPLVSYNLGAKNYDKCRKLLKITLLTETIVSFVCVGLIEIFSSEYVTLFVRNESKYVSVLSEKMLVRYVLCFLIMGINIVASSYLSAICRPKFALIISFGHNLVLQAAVLLIMSLILGGPAVYFSISVSEVCVAVLSIIVLKKNTF